MGVRALKKDGIRRHLADTARGLFARQGFERTTFAQIAREAGVSIRTATRYFPNKADLAFPTHAEQLQRFRATLERHHLPENPIAGIRSAFVELAAGYPERREEFLKEWHLALSSPAVSSRGIELDREFERTLGEMLMRGRFTEQEANVLAGTIFWSVRSVLTQWFASECRLDLRELGQITFSLLGWLSEAYQGRYAVFARSAPDRPLPPGDPLSGENGPPVERTGRRGGHRR